MAGPSCPFCQKPVEGATIRRCQECDIASHPRCSEEMGGCGRFTCPRAQTPWARLVEHARIRTSRDVALSRTITRVVGGWLTICGLAFAGGVLYAFRDPSTRGIAAFAPGLLVMPAQQIGRVLQAEKVVRIPYHVYAAFGFAAPVALWAWLRIRTARLAKLEKLIEREDLSRRSQTMLLDHHAPRAAGAPTVSPQVVSALRISSVIVRLGALALSLKFIIAVKDTGDPTFGMSIGLGAGAMLLGSVALDMAHRALRGAGPGEDTARLLLAAWAPELRQKMRDYGLVANEPEESETPANKAPASKPQGEKRPAGSRPEDAKDE